MLAKSVLVTGCDKGIGLEFIKQLADQTQHLFAGCLSPHQAKETRAIADVHKHVILLHLDITKEETIENAVVKIKEIVGEEGLNCVINNAGILHFINSIENLTVESLQTTYEVNAIGPAMVVKACVPLLRKASSLLSGNEMGVSRAAIVNISSTAGSMESERGEKLFYSYRNSKMALNMLAKNLSIELKPDKISILNLNPGWVQTDMGGSCATQTKQQSVEGMLQVISNLNEKTSGLFYNWNGDEIPW